MIEVKCDVCGKTVVIPDYFRAQYTTEDWVWGAKICQNCAEKYTTDSLFFYGNPVIFLPENMMQKINTLFRGMPSKRRIAFELLELARQGIKSPKGGLWTLFKHTKHANKYMPFWYRHARFVLSQIPELASELGVEVCAKC